MSDIFISYSRYDSDVVNELVALLEREGYSVWIDRDGIESGDDFKRVILKAIKGSKVVLFFSSEHSNVSDWTAKEIGVAVKYKKHIIPIMLDDSNFNEAVEFDLINFDYVDYSKVSTRLAMRERLIKTLRNKLGVGSKESERLEAERKAKEEAERARHEKEWMEKAKVEHLAKESAEKRLEKERKADEARLKVTIEREELVPEGAIKGVFSVSPTKKILFSKGNLQYQASTGVWRFAERQYDVIGDGNKRISRNNDDWIDLFGWGTGDNPTNDSTDDENYSQFVDWGTNQISNGGKSDNMWESMTQEEWLYILEGRNTISGVRYVKVRVNDVKGLLLLPDDWDKIHSFVNANQKDKSFSDNSISSSIWSLLEASGAVFLPAAGNRSGNSVYGVGSYGMYWSFPETNRIYNEASRVYVDDTELIACYPGHRYRGHSVRLVCPTE